MRTLRLLNLHCNRTDNYDNTKVNETILTVDNGKFQGFGPEPMVNGSNWNVNKNIQFNEATISFYDEDLIRHLSDKKHIRTHVVEENEIITGQNKVNFASNNANYILTYEII